MARLIFDVGMHTGKDTAFYLSRGHKVIGVEANPELIESLRKRFYEKIASGQLYIVDKAIADQSSRIKFAKFEHTSFGTVSPKFIERNETIGKAPEFVEVDTITLAALIRQFGTPYYLKVDIEGMDMACVRSLHDFTVKPEYLSLESMVTSGVADFEAAFDELAHLWVLGYRQYKYVDQPALGKLNGTLLDIEGEPVRYQTHGDCSGPFGKESPGEWQSISSALMRMKALLVYQNTIGMGGRHHKKLLSRIGRSTNRCTARTVGMTCMRKAESGGLRNLPAAESRSGLAT